MILSLQLNEIFDVASLISFGDYALNFINTHNRRLLLGFVLMTKKHNKLCSGNPYLLKGRLFYVYLFYSETQG